jgi:hypothetical protein
MLGRKCGRCSPILGFRLVEDVAYVGIDCTLGDVKLFTYLAISQTRCYQLEHFDFTARKSC